MIDIDNHCPCGSGEAANLCCQLLHAGEIAHTAQDLMRSRYSAYVKKNVKYLYDTTHKEKRSPSLLDDIQLWITQPNWLGLEIIKCSNGQSNDKVGKVEFIARYSLKGEEKQIHELSRFKRYQGKWCYLDGKNCN